MAGVSATVRGTARRVMVAVIAAGLVMVVPTAPGGADGNEAPGNPAAFRAITAGGHHTCALSDDGTVKCWGWNSYGQLGLGDATDRGNNPGEMGDDLPAVALGAGRTATAITAGGSHTCALLDNGTVKCWGWNSYGQLGLGDATSRGDGPGEMGDDLPAVALGAGRTATAISANSYRTCALLDDGAVKCWGQNNYGQSGLGHTTQRGDGPGEMGDNLPAVSLGAGRTADSVTAGLGHTCALLDNGTVKCWGLNRDGQLGVGDVANRGDGPGEMGDNLPAVSLGAGRTADSVTAGLSHTCALLDNGTVKCWGSGASGQLGSGGTAALGDGPAEMGDDLPAVALGAGSVATALTVGSGHSCAVLVGGAVKCWGYNYNGQLGLGVTANRGDGPGEMGDDLAVVSLGAGRTATAVTTGYWHTCARLDDGVLKCWGVNTFGQLGLGDTTPRGDGPGEMGDNLPAVDLGPLPAPALTVVKSADETSVSAGQIIQYHVVITNTGNVALSNVTVADANAPGCDRNLGTLAVGVATTVDCTHVAVAGDIPTYANTASVDTDQTAPLDSNQVDVAVTAVPTAATAVAAGGQHTCARLDDGTVRCWGSNLLGRLGLGDTAARGDGAGEMGADLPTVALGTGRTATAVTAGEAHTCALLDNGAVKCWGNNTQGQLGLGDTAARGDGPGEMGDSLPVVALGAGRTAVAVVAGGFHTCALLDNGAVKCWGSSGSGQLGLGDTGGRGDEPNEMGDNLPTVALGTGRTATAIAAVNTHTCAVLDNGAVKCWGDNAQGRLGLGDTAARGDGPGEMGDSLPAVALGTGRTATAVTAGDAHTCALLDDGGVKCWGYNNSGQLALGDTANRGDGPAEMGDNLPAVALGTGRTATAVTAGSLHTCALLDDGGVKCWGNNSGGQSGLGDVANRGDAPGEMGDSLPAVSLGAGRTATAVSATTDAHACALLDNGAVKCWGLNVLGRLGQGDTANRGDGPGEMGDSLPAVGLFSVAAASLTATLSAEEASVVEGDTVHLHLLVANTGNESLHNVTVTDANAPDCDGNVGTVAVAATLTVDCTHVVGPGDGPTYSNTATVDADETTPIDSNPIAVTVVVANPSLSVVGSADEDAVSPGEPIHFHLAIANTGDVMLTGITLADDEAPACAGPVPDLPPGAEWFVDCVYVTALDDGGVVITNVAVVDSEQTDPIESNGVDIEVGPAMTVVQTAPARVIAGHAIQYQIDITNTSAVTLRRVQVTDPFVSGCTAAVANIAVGQSRTVTCSRATADTDTGFTLVNVAYVNTRGGGFGVSELVETRVRGRVTGTITGPSGPVAGAYVLALSETFTPLRGDAVSDGSGAFELGVDPGRYYLVFLDPSGATQAEYYNDKTSVAQLTASDLVTVTVGSGPATANAVLAASPFTPPVVPATISGTVTDANGPLAGIWVVAINGGVRSATRTNASGEYTVGNLPAGTSYLEFADPTGAHAFRWYHENNGSNPTGIALTAGQSLTGIDELLPPYP